MGSIVQGSSCWLYSPVYTPVGLLLPLNLPSPVLTQGALGAPGGFAAFDDMLTLTVQATDGDECHGGFLPQGGDEDKTQCDSNRSPSPLLKHYQKEVGNAGRKRLGGSPDRCSDQ